MITLYRIVKSKWTSTAFNGDGARLYGGRWNNVGNSAVYVTGSESLAILEVLVHLKNTKLLDEYVLFSMEIDEADILMLDDENLPSNWNEEPAPAETAEIGDQWLKGGSSLALSLPSVIVPRERNYLLNPKHEKFEQLAASARKLNISIDSRLI